MGCFVESNICSTNELEKYQFIRNIYMLLTVHKYISILYVTRICSQHFIMTTHRFTLLEYDFCCVRTRWVFRSCHHTSI